jgi:hypothetical protein
MWRRIYEAALSPKPQARHGRVAHTCAYGPAERIRVNLRTEDGGEVLLEIATVKAWLIEGMLL